MLNVNILLILFICTKLKINVNPPVLANTNVNSFLTFQKLFLVSIAEKKLTDVEIQELLFGDNSDIDVDSDSGDETQHYQVQALDSSDDSGSDDSSSDRGHDPILKPQKKTCGGSSRNNGSHTWKARNFSVLTNLEETAELPVPQGEPGTPLTYFEEYFDEDLWELIATRTNLYNVQTNGTTLAMTKKEAKVLFGVHIVMGNLKFPQARMYWAASTRVSLVADSIPRNRFFRLRNALHVCNNFMDKDDSDRCWKVRPILEKIRMACLKIPRPQVACVDEQMIPFAGHTQLRQYVRGKPNPTGLKNFVVADSTGRVLDFEIYQGATTRIPSEHKDLGIGGGVVMRLSETMPRDEGRVLCFDRYFTSVPLIERLLTYGTFGHGTVMNNRIS